MKKLIKLTYLTAILVVFSNFLFAQKATWGKVQTSESKHYHPYILGEDSKGIYTFARVKRDIVIEKFNRKSKDKEFSVVIDPPKIGKYKVVLEDVELIKDKFLVFASYYDKEKKETNLFAYTYSSENGKKLDQKIELFNIEVEKRRRDGNFMVMTSPDRTKILINHYAYYRKEKKYRDKYVLLDENLNKLLDKDEEIVKSEKDYSTYNYIIDNDGSIFFMKKYSFTENYITTYDANKSFEKWEEKIILDDLKSDESITNVDFTINKENQLVVTGYYSKKNQLYGCFFTKIDNLTKEIIVTKLNKFDEDFKKQFLSNRKLKKGKDGKIYNIFDNIEIITKDDGGIILIGEMAQHTYYYDHNGNYRGEVVMYNDMIALNISAEGTLIWGHKIPKRQYYYYMLDYYPIVIGSFGVRLFVYPTDYPDYFSYLAGINDKELVIVFNDNLKNLEKGDNDKLKKMKNINSSVAMCYKINLEDGKKNKKILYDIKNINVLLQPSVSFQFDQESDIIIFGKKKKKFKYGTLDI